MNYQMQNNILKHYRTYAQGKTLSQMAKETGIQQTRLFRIFNGAEMRLSEYELLNVTLKKQNLKPTSRIDQLIHEAAQILDPQTLKEIYQHIQKKISVNEIIY